LFIKGTYHWHHIGFQARWPLPITAIPFGWTRGTVSKVDVGHGSLVRYYTLIVLLRLGGMQDELAQPEPHVFDERRAKMRTRGLELGGSTSWSCCSPPCCISLNTALQDTSKQSIIPVIPKAVTLLVRC